MNTQEIFNLANELTEQEVNNIVATLNTKEVNQFNSLISLGDSKELSCATVIAEKYNDKGVSDIYRIAYES